ncbi:MAG: molybdopterin cofactor-binding domain-containing protein, partial [Elusimicrobiota bacterium]|nr:molybdopterin cofactor-binding domain-containing protein [Elusimicrobiota bacterium]
MEIKDTKKMKVVNKRVTKNDALGLACGMPEFTDDVDINGLLHCKMLWSPHAHALIKHIDTKAAMKVPGIKVILTYKDVPRIPHTKAGQGFPEPSPYDTYVLDNKVRFVGDRVAAVCGETLEACDEALKKIKVDYKVLRPVFDPIEAMKDGAPVIHDEKDSKNIPDVKRNIAAKFDFEVKNGEWFKDADFIIENTYTMPYIQHCALEPHIAISYLDAKGRIVIRTATQVPFHVRRIVAQALDIPVKN